jgi:hypothetical protein
MFIVATNASTMGIATILLQDPGEDFNQSLLSAKVEYS